MWKFKTFSFSVAVLLCLVLAGCSKTDDQKKFEDKAFSLPSNYTAMTANGQPASSNQTDPDDWRISPMYQGLVEISTPAYPNPVALNNTLRLEIDIVGIESVPGLQIYVFQEAQNLFGPIDQLDQSQLSPGIRVFILEPSSFAGASTGQGVSGFNRLVIFDGRDNVISYGDVLVE